MIENDGLTVRRWLVVSACALLVGCSGEEGPQRYMLSGNVTYDGQPVPYGMIIFSPTSGPGATANIEAGRYETPPGFGAVGGMHTINVVGFRQPPRSPSDASDAVSEPPLFKYQFQQELPREATTLDFAITRDDVARQ